MKKYICVPFDVERQSVIDWDIIAYCEEKTAIDALRKFYQSVSYIKNCHIAVIQVREEPYLGLPTRKRKFIAA